MHMIHLLRMLICNIYKINIKSEVESTTTGIDHIQLVTGSMSGVGKGVGKKQHLLTSLEMT